MAALAFGAPPTEAAVLTVGTGGTYATIQAALDSAVATSDDDEVRIRSGIYFERLSISSGDLGGRLEMSGGWDATFTNRDPDPAATVIDAESVGRVLGLNPEVTAGSLVLLGLTFQHGRVTEADILPLGAGLLLFAKDVPMLVKECRVVSNETTDVEAPRGHGGAGIWGVVRGTASLSLIDVEVTDNLAELVSVTDGLSGAGVNLFAYDFGEIVIRGSNLSRNSLSGGRQRHGAGLWISSKDHSSVLIEDSSIVGNSTTEPTAPGEYPASALALQPAGKSVVVAQRLEVTDNVYDASDTSNQFDVLVIEGESPAVLVRDSLIARGGSGLHVYFRGSGVFKANHLTITDHQATGADLDGAMTLYNSIIWDNLGGDVSLLTGASLDHDLVGVDPLFSAPDDYHLTPLSPAVDTGTPSPAGGLSSLDLDHAPRWVGAAPDQGAYELGGLFGDDFESGDTSAWSFATP